MTAQQLNSQVDSIMAELNEKAQRSYQEHRELVLTNDGFSRTNISTAADVCRPEPKRQVKFLGLGEEL
jgi:hypothetical protein